MARMPRETITKSQLPEASEALKQDMTATDALSVATNNYTAERDLMNQMWGQIQMADAVSKLTTVVSLQKLAYIKESKLYRALRGKTAHDKDGDEIADVGTWDGFCRAIGSSRTKVDEDLTNLAVFGEDALNHLSAIGAGYRELRQYRQLPTDEKTALIEVAQSGDKDSFIDLAESIIAKHAAEKAGLHKEVEEAQANYEGLVKVSETKERIINDQQREMAKLRRRLDSMTPDEVGADLRQEVAGVGYQIEGLINTDLMTAFDALADHAQAHNCTHEEFMSGLLFGIERALLAVRNKHNVKAVPDGDERPDWTRDDFDADAVVAAALAKEAGHVQ
ncbi:MAG: hypothetical protein IPG66_05740 [Hydrogenophilales bacterium]|nr:hypothetical protein [Hydrogenophilales bacterium]